MSERTRLLKKAVLTSVGAGTNVDRIKSALNEAMQDLVKVGNNLLDELEEKGKVKTESVQEFLKHFQAEAQKKTSQVEKKVSTGMKKVVRELGLITQEDWEEMCERLTDIEEALGIAQTDGNGGHSSGGKTRGRRKKHNT
jgi:polyhydroxyalkanoate synthesis regulator phasin